jgi:type III pantothenate kinase
MSWLLLDAGNTALKWAIASTDGLAPEVQRIDNADAQFAALLERQLAAATTPISAAFGCCVASDAQRAQIDAAVSAAGAGRVHWLHSEARSEVPEAPLVNGYRLHTQLGPDRWHAMLGARHLHPDRALVVVHAGTATTIDCVTADGRFAGGVILPGMTLMLDSLARRTARLPQAQGAAVAFPDNTDDAITSGVADAQAGAIERVVVRFAPVQGAPVLLLLGGGAAAALAAQLRALPQIERSERAHNLVLRGLWLRARALAR